jgi:hypothetical protein
MMGDKRKGSRIKEKNNKSHDTVGILGVQGKADFSFDNLMVSP